MSRDILDWHDLLARCVAAEQEAERLRAVIDTQNRRYDRLVMERDKLQHNQRGDVK